MTPNETLKHYFGYDHFRPGQAEIINQVLAKKNTLAIMPTGGGKSLCYQIPALILPGITLVVSPLIALMKDQVDALNDNGIPAAFINSSLDYASIQNNLSLALTWSVAVAVRAKVGKSCPKVARLACKFK